MQGTTSSGNHLGISHSSPPFFAKPFTGDASRICGLVPMPELLRELGFNVNERTHRCSCVLHGGRNPSSFSWTEGGQWFCHNCGVGGDRIELVKRVRGCDFKEALQFLATLAGVELSDPPGWRKEIEKRRREQQRIEINDKKLDALECAKRGLYREEIGDLEEIRKKAGERLRSLNEGAAERFKNENDFWWGALEFAARYLPRALAGYTIAAFVNVADRARFALRPEERNTMIDETIILDFVMDDAGRVCEVLQ